MRLYIVFDNHIYQKPCQTAWGFSCLFPEEGVLFDTGSSGSILLYNFRCLKISLSQINTIVLSHFHWDHIGGLLDLLTVSSHKRIIIHSGFSSIFAQEIKRLGGKVELIDEPIPLTPQIFTTGKIEGPIPEVGLVFKGEKIQALVTGCAHPGIDNMAYKVKKDFPDLNLLLGGFHFLNKDTNYIWKTAKSLKTLGIHYIAPSHCTGEKAIEILKSVFSKGFIKIGVGKKLDI